MKRIVAAVTAAVLLSAASAGSAHAAKPAKRVLATPSAVCKAFVEFGAASSYGACVGSLKKEMDAFRFPSEDGVPMTLDQQCAGFEATFLTYPFFFVEEDPAWPFPQYTAQNRNQCKATLFAYHTLVQTLGPPPGS